MKNFNRVFGPIPSRRLGRSLGISPIPRKACNYSCIYCQLGRTNAMTNKRQNFYRVEDIIEELRAYLKQNIDFDVITLVGEGEPTLYLDLEKLLVEIKKLTEKPVAVITNGALLSDENVRIALMNADIVLPTIDAYNKEMYKKINRPYGTISWEEGILGLIEFSKNYHGQIWIEIMLMDNINANREDIDNFKILLDKIKYDRIFINTPVRPPAEEYVNIATQDELNYAIEKLNAISIEKLTSGSFYSEIKDTYLAILNIIKRHPMTQFEIKSFIISRDEEDEIELIIERLDNDKKVEHIDYKGIRTYRLGGNYDKINKKSCCHS